MFDVLLRAYQAALDIMSPGAKRKDEYNPRRKVVEKAGYLDYFVSSSRYPQYYIGHGIGFKPNGHLLIGPQDETILKPNMVTA
nr:M24 family metallopeptidase [Desulfobacterales bacterium]